jgi:hypothetical protein
MTEDTLGGSAQELFQVDSTLKDANPYRGVRVRTVGVKCDALLASWRALASGDHLVAFGNSWRFQYPLKGHWQNSSLGDRWAWLGSRCQRFDGERRGIAISVLSEVRLQFDSPSSVPASPSHDPVAP